MMKRYVLVVLAMMVSSTCAFTASSTSTVTTGRSQQRHMFSTDGSESTTQSSTASTANNPSPLEIVETKLEETQPTIRTSTPVERPGMMAKNMNTGEVKEVKWIDPAMRANTNPLQMDWWAYPLFGLPIVLLLNDALHFIPEEGPLSYLLRF